MENPRGVTSLCKRTAPVLRIQIKHLATLDNLTPRCQQCASNSASASSRGHAHHMTITWVMCLSRRTWRQISLHSHRTCSHTSAWVLVTPIQLYLEVFPYFELMEVNSQTYSLGGKSKHNTRSLFSHTVKLKTRPRHASWSGKKDPTTINSPAWLQTTTLPNRTWTHLATLRRSILQCTRYSVYMHWTYSV